ncbi:choice-of-anchor D domain-containing protein [Hymenobacter artigasi]|uniref:Choice-of-anchor D domain-containing protein n=1 Tax=Hymenobacter artigasi TaxID=2719616 RepID=A0ABX1HML1_9BACT|nr:choice-of-anchor D domain-containing protein [Hymenobacter artigasi]NKI90362.1 hypothetical protein [Hymenobacter artigasi]
MTSNNAANTGSTLANGGTSRIDEILVEGTAAPTNSINTPTFATTALCASTAASLDVTFMATGTFTAGNTFNIQLSNGSGVFPSMPVVIGSISNTVTTAQTVTTTIPAGTASGTGYLIRVVADGPATTSSPASAALTIVSNPTLAIAPTTTQTFVAGGSGSLLTATETPVAAGNTRVWQVSSTSGGTFSNISPAQTGVTYTPTFATVGTYFVRVLSTFAACAAVTSNEVEIDVTNPVPTITGISPSQAMAGSPDFTLTITGTNFVAASTTTFNGVSRVTTYVSATQLTVAVLAADVATVGNYNVAVTNASGTTAATAASTFAVLPQPTGTACLTQDFENATFPPTGWLTSGATRSTAAGDIKTGSGAAIFGSNTGTLTTATLVNPNLLTFALGRSTNTTVKSLIVEVSTTTQTGTFTPVATYDHSNVPSGSYDVYYVDLSAYATTAQVWVRFRKASSTTSPWRLDDVNVYCSASAPAPKIDVTQGATAIPSGTGSYAFASTGVGTTTDATFTISNNGTDDLLLSGTPAVAVTGADASQFSITQQPASTTLTPSGTTSATTFVVRFQPTTTGAKTAGISIANNDSNKNPYTFALTGTGLNVTPTLTATQNTLTFTTTAGQAATQSYVLTGSNLAANAAVAISSNNASLQVSTNGGISFAATATATTTASGTLSQTVQVRFTAPATVGSGSATISNTTGSLSAPVAVTTTTAIPLASAPGLLLLEDNFNYASGTLLSANGWAVHSGITGTNGDAPTTVAGNLTNISYPTGPLASNANHVSSIGTSTDVNKGFTALTGSNTVYYSVLLNIPTGGTRTDYFLHFLERTNTAGTSVKNFRAKLFARSGTAANTFNLGVSITSNPNETPAPSYSTAEYAEGQSYLVVVKYVFVPGGNDAVSLFVFDNATAAPVTEPATAIASLQQANNATFALPNGIAIRQTTTSPYIDIDGIRVATGWGAAVGNPVYTAATAVINAGNYYALTMNDAAALLTPNGNANVESALTLTNGFINTTATNSLTLYQTATVSGGSSTSYVNGPVLRPLGIIAATTTPLSFTFPVGKGNFYRPITLSLTEHKAPSVYTATQTEVNPNRTLASGSGLGTAPLARVSSKRFYTVTSSNTTAGNFTGTVTLSFGAEDYVNVPSSTDFVIAKRDATGPFANQWTNLGRSGNTGTDSGAGGPSVAGTLTSASFSDFSDFVLGAQNDLSNTNVLAATNPLPVELTRFSAQRQADKTVAVKWATASEKNSARFEVQRSLNGREFATIDTVAAQGSSTRPTAYGTLDKAAPAALLYYRLRQVDLDGTSALSPVVTVLGAGQQAAKVPLYPNPAHSRISFIAAAATPYRVLNQLGQPLLHGTTEAGTASIGLEALPTGLYFLELQTATGRTVQKFEKTTE